MILKAHWVNCIVGLRILLAHWSGDVFSASISALRAPFWKQQLLHMKFDNLGFMGGLLSVTLEKFGFYKWVVGRFGEGSVGV